MEAYRHGIPYESVRIKTDTCYHNNECYCLKHWLRFHGDNATDGRCVFQTKENATEGALCSKAEHCITYTHPIDGCSHNRLGKNCPWWYHGIQFHRDELIQSAAREGIFLNLDNYIAEPIETRYTVCIFNPCKWMNHGLFYHEEELHNKLDWRFRKVPLDSIQKHYRPKANKQPMKRRGG
jgi:hypothetical protein